jgi:L-ascorbate metabolism protein UlaG (beta-lactamase superfamily)
MIRDRFFLTGGLLFLLATLAQPALSASPDDSCASPIPAMIGGPLPQQNRLVLRWLGTSNVEMTYNNQIILFDAFFDRGPRNRSVGFMPKDVVKADAVFIGHGHADHMGDAAQVAQQTSAKVYGAKTTTDVLVEQGLPAKKFVTVKGGEIFRFDGFKVETILAAHSQLDPKHLQRMMAILEEIAGPTDTEGQAREDALKKRGSNSPDVLTKGTIVYLVTFDNGFTFLFRNTAGPITEAERKVAARENGVDIAAIAYQGQILARRQVPVTLDLVKLYKPRDFFPVHHDEFVPVFLDMGVEPLFMAIRDDVELKDTRRHSLLYREPLCFDFR